MGVPIQIQTPNGPMTVDSDSARQALGLPPVQQAPAAPRFDPIRTAVDAIQFTTGLVRSERLKGLLRDAQVDRYAVVQSDATLQATITAYKATLTAADLVVPPTTAAGAIYQQMLADQAKTQAIQTAMASSAQFQSAMAGDETWQMIEGGLGLVDDLGVLNPNGAGFGGGGYGGGMGNMGAFALGTGLGAAAGYEFGSNNNIPPRRYLPQTTTPQNVNTPANPGFNPG